MEITFVVVIQELAVLDILDIIEVLDIKAEVMLACRYAIREILLRGLHQRFEGRRCCAEASLSVSPAPATLRPTLTA